MMVKVSCEIKYHSIKLTQNLSHTLTDDDESGELFREEDTKTKTKSEEDDGDKTKKIE